VWAVGEFPGWQADALGGRTLTISIGGEEIRLATVTYDAEHGLYETFIGRPMAAHQLGRIDASRELRSWDDLGLCEPRI
jgi:hypothetical protein